MEVRHCSDGPTSRQGEDMSPQLAIAMKKSLQEATSVTSKECLIIGNDGLTNEDRTALAEKYARTAASGNGIDIRATMERVRRRRLARLA